MMAEGATAKQVPVSIGTADVRTAGGCKGDTLKHDGLPVLLAACPLGCAGQPLTLALAAACLPPAWVRRTSVLPCCNQSRLQVTATVSMEYAFKNK